MSQFKLFVTLFASAFALSAQAQTQAPDQMPGSDFAPVIVCKANGVTITVSESPSETSTLEIKEVSNGVENVSYQLKSVYTEETRSLPLYASSRAKRELVFSKSFNTIAYIVRTSVEGEESVQSLSCATVSPVVDEQDYTNGKRY